MRMPSDAQARALGLVSEYALAAATLYWPRQATGEEQDFEHRSRAELWTEHEDREAGSRFVPLGWSCSLPRMVTLHACIGHGWIAATHELLLARGLTAPNVFDLTGRDPDPVVLRELGLTEDGTLALGLWRHRKLTAPPSAPTLAGRDREIVALAEHAARLGFRLAPSPDAQARADARRLAREGWVSRGYLGTGVRTLVPTACGEVEVNPQAADTAR